MSSKKLSPMASLLRNSRVFSLPPPLPPPNRDFTETALFTSGTATQPSPRLQAIETTPSSLSRGDWGLKRPLPLRSTTRTSTPTLRISAIDSIDHITDFDSAADHVLTLRKWQEMAIPLQVASSNKRASQLTVHHSVFESEFHSTETRPVIADSGKASESQNTPESEKRYRKTTRWKFRGPWLAGLTDGEFQSYVEKQIRRRRYEFLPFVRKWLSKKNIDAQRRTAQENGTKFDEASAGLSDEEFQNEILRVRDNPLLLGDAIWEFLDLPGESPKNEYYVDLGPPATHPSGGLSYLRTASHTPNHPIFGPLRTSEPLQARVLETTRWKGVKDTAMLGVGGIVAARESSATHKLARFEPQWENFNPDIVGGAKMWVHPQEASFDPEGRIRLKVSQASQDTIAVWKSPVKGGGTTDMIPNELGKERISELDKGSNINQEVGRGQSNPQEDKIMRLLEQRGKDGVPELLSSL